MLLEDQAPSETSRFRHVKKSKEVQCLCLPSFALQLHWPGARRSQLGAGVPLFSSSRCALAGDPYGIPYGFCCGVDSETGIWANAVCRHRLFLSVRVSANSEQGPFHASCLAFSHFAEKDEDTAGAARVVKKVREEAVASSVFLVQTLRDYMSCQILRSPGRTPSCCRYSCTLLAS